MKISTQAGLALLAILIGYVVTQGGGPMVNMGLQQVNNGGINHPAEGTNGESIRHQAEFNCRKLGYTGAKLQKCIDDVCKSRGLKGMDLHVCRFKVRISKAVNYVRGEKGNMNKGVSSIRKQAKKRNKDRQYNLDITANSETVRRNKERREAQQLREERRSRRLSNQEINPEDNLQGGFVW